LQDQQVLVGQNVQSCFLNLKAEHCHMLQRAPEPCRRY